MVADVFLYDGNAPIEKDEFVQIFSLYQRSAGFIVTLEVKFKESNQAVFTPNVSEVM